MKQKRKVKSLISQDRIRGSYEIAMILCALGIILCAGALSLLGMSVFADSVSKIEIEGLTDKIQVLHRMQFVTSQDLKEIKAQMYAENKNLYIEPLVIVNPLNPTTKEISTSVNTLDDGLYGNILGGRDNKLHSDNITIIAGNNNNIVTGNDNATVLGGESNTYSQSAEGGSSVVVAGGRGNKLGGGHDGAMLIGGSNNEIAGGAKNSAILGGKNNKVGQDNSIIGGSGVNASAVKNAFAFSDGNGGKTFEPETSNAFYLNVEKGLGINTSDNTSNGGVGVKGAISIGKINLNEPCEMEDIGVIGTMVDGDMSCLVGCTRQSMEDGNKWELIDWGKECENMCEHNSHCLYTGRTEVPLPSNYVGHCTKKTVENATMCKNVNNFYENEVFETEIINSTEECPTQQNKCVFKCNTGTHLFFGNECISDCVIPWSETGAKIQHNDEIIAYDTLNAYCSTDDPKNPEDGDNCDNHKKVLLCVRGTLVIKGTNNVSAISKNYKYESCNLREYTCDPAVYNLDVNTLQTVANETSTGISYIKTSGTDRNNINVSGTRGIYRLCIDSKPVGGTQDSSLNGGLVKQNGASCSLDNTDNGRHYQLVGCQPGYTTGANHPYQCRKNCTFNNVPYKDGVTITGYAAPSASCPDVCKSERLTCDDGDWKGNKGAYTFSSCSLNGDACQGRNVPSSTVKQYWKTSIYDEGCQVYIAEGQFQCKDGDTKYKLIGCKEGYHTQNDLYCISNDDNWPCIHAGAPVAHHYEYIPGLVPVHWFGQWNSKPVENYWTTPANCDWKCENGHHLEEGDCLSNSKLELCKTDGVSHPVNSHLKDTELKWVYWQGSWNGGHWGPRANCDWECNPNYHLEDGACVANENTVECNTKEVYKPENSHYKKVSINQTYSNGAWSAIPDCEWECDEPTYHEENGACVKSTETLTCNTGGVTLPSDAYFIVIPVNRTYVNGEWSAIPDCEWNCNSCFTKNASAGKCEKKSYTITYDANGGSPKPSSQTVACGDSANLASAPSKTDCTFSSWAANGSTYSAGASYKPTANVTMSASWSCSYSCVGSFTNATQVNGIGSATSSVTSTLYETETEAKKYNCSYICKDGYHKSGNTCVSNTQTKDCGGNIPGNATAKNGHGKFTQTWNGSSWTPASKNWSYDGSECGFLCNTNLVWDSATSSCVTPAEPTYTCAAGKYLPKNSTTCSDCPCGYYCEGGTWTKSTTSDQGKKQCASGKYSEKGKSSCSSCASGKTPNSTQCGCVDSTYTCSAGKYLPANSTTCSDCPCGYYCPGGTWSKSTSDQGKTKCASNTYSEKGKSSCSSCASGKTPNSTQCGCVDITYTCSAGKYLPANSTTCSDCPCGYYCPGGTWSKSTSDQGKNQCASGKYSEKGKSSCSSCPTGQTPNSTKCGCETSTQKANCTGLPNSNIYVWVNSKFTQTWNGSSWTPSSKTPTLTTDSSVECSYKCNTNITNVDFGEACCADSQCIVGESGAVPRRCKGGICSECENFGGGCTKHYSDGDMEGICLKRGAGLGECISCNGTNYSIAPGTVRCDYAYCGTNYAGECWLIDGQTPGKVLKTRQVTQAADGGWRCSYSYGSEYGSTSIHCPS